MNKRTIIIIAIIIVLAWLWHRREKQPTGKPVAVVPLAANSNAAPKPEL